MVSRLGNNLKQLTGLCEKSQCGKGLGNFFLWLGF